MKLSFSKDAYDQLDDESQARMTAIKCTECTDLTSADCWCCEGEGVIYEYILDKATAAAITENFQRQGLNISLPKEDLN